MGIERWDPFSDFMTLRDAMNRLIEESYVRPGGTAMASAGRMGVPIDLRETESEYILEAAMPGINPEDVDVTVLGNQVTIKGEMKDEAERKGERYHLRERRSGRFQRSLALPTNVDANAASCEFNNGMLVVTLPKAEESKPRRIPLSSAQHGGQSGRNESGGESREG